MSKFSNFLENIQKLPDSWKKTIVWAITIILGIILFGFWGYMVYKKVDSFDANKAAQDLNVGALEEKINQIQNASDSSEQDIINQPSEEKSE